MGTLIRDGVKIGGTTVYVDSNLSTTSENPVENKIVTSALNEKANTSSLANVATTGSYNDLSNTPTIDNTLSTESTNAVQNKIIANSLDEKYPIDYDVALSLAEWEALGVEKYYNHKNYYIYDAGVPTEKPIVYGWHVDSNESDPTAAVSYTKEAIGMTPASMGTTSFNYGSWKDAFFMPKPCMVKENGEVDYYLDENDYTKAKDVITITSTPDNELPLSFNSTNEDITLNYQVYGDSDGSGVETENLFDGEWQVGYWALSDGQHRDSTHWVCSLNKFPCVAGSAYSFKYFDNSRYYSIGWYDSNGNYISMDSEQNSDDTGYRTFTAVAPNNAAYMSISIGSYPGEYDLIEPSTAATLMLVTGSTAPASYIPYGYKIPILNTSGVTENLFDPNATDTSKGYAMSKQFNENGEIVSRSGWFISEYIEIESNQSYTLWYRSAGFTSVLYYCLYDVNKNLIRVIGSNESIIQQVFTTTSTEKYIRFCEPNSVKQETMIQQGNISEYNYVPHRYESNYDLFISDTKLYENEYLDFVEQKVYKRTANYFTEEGSGLVDVTGEGAMRFGKSLGAFSAGTYTLAYQRVSQGIFISERTGSTYTLIASTAGNYTFTLDHDVDDLILRTNSQTDTTWADLGFTDIMLVDGSTVPETYIPYLQPTDPPVPLPKINAYQGENTLSSTETVGDVTIFAKSDIDDLSYNGNAMIEWPLIWWKYESGKVDGEGSFYVSNRKIDDTYNCWCNYDSKNNIISNFYTAIYNGGIYNGKLRSMSGYKLTDRVSTVYSNTSTYAIDDKVLYNSNMYICITAINTPEEFDNNKWVQIPINGITTGTQEVNAATSNNTTSDVEWYIDVWADRMLINGLLILMGKSLNVQTTFGQGITSGSQTAKNNYTTGSLNDKGMFYGSVSGTTTAVKVFGMENWWGLSWHRTAGLVGTSTGYAYKMTYNNIDGSTATSYNSNGSGYLTLSTTRPSANNYVIKMKYGLFGYIPIDTTGGSSTTYYCDYYYGGNGYLLVGGCSGSGGGAGLSFFYLSGAFASANWGVGVCLSLKPLANPSRL